MTRPNPTKSLTIIVWIHLCRLSVLAAGLITGSLFGQLVRVDNFKCSFFCFLSSPTPENSQNEMPTGSSLSATNLATDQCLLFSYTVFEFISNSDESNDLKLTCNVKACEFSETNPDNMAPCVENTCGGGRKRRSILEKEQYVTVSQSFTIYRND